MALPGHYRAYKWHTRVVAAGENSPATYRALLWAIKDAIVGGGDWTDSEGDPTSAPNWWTVTGSSDGSASSHDGTDRWESASDVGDLSSGTKMPWIVIANAAMGRAIAIQKSVGSSWQNSDTVVFSHVASASDGSATTAPTYASACSMYSGGAWGKPSGAVATRLHCWQSETSVNWLLARNGWLVAYGHLDALRDVYGDASPVVGRMRGSPNSTSAPSGHEINADGGGLLGVNARRVDDAGDQILTLESLSALGATAGPDRTGEYVLRPLIAYSTQDGETGPRGWLADRYAVVTASDKLGFPDDDEPTWVSLAGYAWPWNKTPLVLTA